MAARPRLDGYARRARAWARRVVEGKIPNGAHAIAACQRFLSDLSRIGDPDFPYRLTDDGGRWCEFLEKLPHVKGQWAQRHELLVLSDWQIFCIVNMYGWVHAKKHLRRFTAAYIEVPRKNGKTFMVAGLGIGHLTIDHEFGAEVYCGATTEAQAWEVFRPARMICLRDPDIAEAFGIDVNAKTLYRISDAARFQPVIGNPGDGSSPSAAIVDEFHEHQNSNMIDTFRTGMGARAQPMLIMITTAGSDMGGPCYAVRSDAINILTGAVSDERVFAIIFGVDDGDEWDTEAALVKANPNIDISVSRDFLLGELAQARRSSTKQSAYRTKHLNQWVGAKQAWMNMLAYQACRKRDAAIEKHRGERCIVGVDLASKLDVASVAIFFPDSGAAFVRHYLPEDTILKGGNTRYRAWHAEGALIATPGNVIDYERIEDDLKELSAVAQIMEVAYDPFQAVQFATRLEAAGFAMVQYGQTVRNMSEPMKELEAMIINKRIHFDHDPVLMWMFGNVVAKLDKKDNIFPNKERDENKIDGVVALIMCVGRWLTREPERVPDFFVA